MRKYSWLLAAMTLAVLFPLRNANATAFPLTRFETASYSIDAGGGSFFSYDAFQPNLQGFNWQIERTTIYITQTVTLQVSTPPHFVPLPPFGILQPRPYAFNYKVNQEFTPLGSVFARGFSTEFAPTRTFSGVASGSGGVTSVTRLFNYTLVFDATSDLSGGFEFANNAIFKAERNDFLPTSFSDEVFTISDFDAMKLSGRNSSALFFSGSGSFLIQYDGTLFLEEGQDPPAFLTAVPVTLPFPMLIVGFAAVCLIGRRRQSHASCFYGAYPKSEPSSARIKAAPSSVHEAWEGK